LTDQFQEDGIVYMRDAYKMLVVEPERRRPTRKARSRYKDNIKMNIKEVGCKMQTGFIWLRTGISGGIL
jgi:hypothetical protein